MTAAQLIALLNATAGGRFPPADGGVDLVTEPVGRANAVLAFSAHFVVCAPVTSDWVTANLQRDDYTAAHSPAFLQALARKLDADIGALDLVLAAPGVGTGDPAVATTIDRLALTEVADRNHPRVVRALRYRGDVRVWRNAEGTGHLVVGRGLAGRLEGSFEVRDDARGRGLGRDLATAALAMVPVGEPMFMQVSPGNVASLRAVLAAGYQPVGAEVLLPPADPEGFS